MFFIIILKLNPAFAQNLPAPVVNQNLDQRLSTTWQIQEQDVCINYPAKDNAWNLTPSITENNYWFLDPRGTCMDQKGNACKWNYVDGYLQVVFESRQRIYIAHPTGDFMNVQGVIKHLDNPSREGCFIGANQSPKPWTEPRDGNPHRPAPVMNNNGQLPPPIYDPTEPQQQSPR